MKILIFDTETTGIKSKWNPGFTPALVQLACILMDDETQQVYGSFDLLNLDCGPIPEQAAAVHGITNKVVELAGVDMDVIEDVFLSLARYADRLVAHNIAYDLDIIKYNMPATWDQICLIPTYCTKIATTDILKLPLTEKQEAYFAKFPHKKDADYKPPTLAEAYRYYFKKGFEGAHNAMTDVLACRDVYLAANKK